MLNLLMSSEDAIIKSFSDAVCNASITVNGYEELVLKTKTKKALLNKFKCNMQFCVNEK